MFTQRSLLTPMMTTFDQCDTTLPCGQRDVTIVAPQALTLLNNEFVHARTARIAARLMEDEFLSASLRIDRAWRAILIRGPTDDEERIAIEHIVRQRARFAGDGKELAAGGTPVGAATGPHEARKSPEELAWASLCLVLLNSNEFAFVD